MARVLAAAVVTQLFSYMIGKGIQYGYVCTGEAFVFLYVPDDPATVYFSVCVLSLEVMMTTRRGSIALLSRRSLPLFSRPSA